MSTSHKPLPSRIDFPHEVGKASLGITKVMPQAGPPVLSRDDAGKPLPLYRTIEFVRHDLSLYGHTTIDARSGRTYRHRSREKTNSETGEKDNRFSYDAPVTGSILLDLGQAKHRKRLEQIILALRTQSGAMLAVLKDVMDGNDALPNSRHIYCQTSGGGVIVTIVRHTSNHIVAGVLGKGNTYGVCRGDNATHRIRLVVGKEHILAEGNDPRDWEHPPEIVRNTDIGPPPANPMQRAVNVNGTLAQSKPHISARTRAWEVITANKASTEE